MDANDTNDTIRRPGGIQRNEDEEIRGKYDPKKIFIIDVILSIEKELVKERQIDQWIHLDKIKEKAEEMGMKVFDNAELERITKNETIEQRGDYYRVKRIRAPKIINGVWMNK